MGVGIGLPLSHLNPSLGKTVTFDKDSFAFNVSKNPVGVPHRSKTGVHPEKVQEATLGSQHQRQQAPGPGSVS